MPEKADEYEEIGNNLRHYSNASITLISVYSAIAAGTLFVVFKTSPPLPNWQIKLLEISGIAVTALFWIMEISALHLWRHFIRRGAALDSELGYQQYSTMIGAPDFLLRPATLAIHLFFAFFVVFWLLSLLL